jgi:hypothetical protein
MDFKGRATLPRGEREEGFGRGNALPKKAGVSREVPEGIGFGIVTH